MIVDINLTSTSVALELGCGPGKTIIGRGWGSSGDCKAVALLVHGLGAHSGWFEAFARQLQQRRVFSISYDHVGFGNRRYEPFCGYKQWLDDLILVLEHIQSQYPGKSVYLIGNSMGALLSMVCAQTVAPDGLVLLSPGFDGYPRTFTLWYRLTTVVKALLFPNMEIALPYGIELCSRSKSVADWIHNDPSGSFMVPGKMLFQLLQLSNATKHKAMGVTMPVLMMTAGQDKIVDNVINHALYEKLIAPSKETVCFSESFHDLMFDPLVDEVADQVVDWMDRQRKEIATTAGTNP